MKYIAPVSSQEVQAAYMPVTEYVDDSGFNPDDMRHPRWLHPIVPEDKNAPSALELRLAELGVPFQRFGGIDGVRASFDSTLLLVYGRYVPIWPAKDGKYGMAYAPQYAIRDDGMRVSLETVAQLLAGAG